jgi:enoyl-CoA hydratase
MQTTAVKRLILVDIAQEVGVLTINRSESLNALNDEVLDELQKALEALEGEAAVKVVVITGAGGKAFVSGGDIKEMLALDPAGAEMFSRKGQALVLSIERMTKPVIAAVNGYALGGGLELALACDFIYASENARFGLPEVTLGVIPGFGGTQNLARLVGPNKAKELIFSGRILTAQEALQWGIVNRLFPEGELPLRLREVARQIAGNGGRAVAAAKRAIVKGLDTTKQEGFHLEQDLFGALFATQDQKEGMLAFTQKRKPAFKNK